MESLWRREDMARGDSVWQELVCGVGRQSLESLIFQKNSNLTKNDEKSLEKYK